MTSIHRPKPDVAVATPVPSSVLQERGQDSDFTSNAVCLASGLVQHGAARFRIESAYVVRKVFISLKVPLVCHCKFATVKPSTPMENGSIPSLPLAVPPPVKYSSKFAFDINEAEQAALFKPAVQINTSDGIRPFTASRTASNASNASSASSNATTLVDKESDLGEPSPTQSQTLDEDGTDTGLPSPNLHAKSF